MNNHDLDQLQASTASSSNRELKHRNIGYICVLHFFKLRFFKFIPVPVYLYSYCIPRISIPYTGAPIINTSSLMFRLDAATQSIAGLGVLELLLAMRMSAVNMEQMKVARNAVQPRKAAEAFLRSTYYKKWSRAQLNNTEYAPMLAVLMLLIKYKADRAGRKLTAFEEISCYGAFVSSFVFVVGLVRQGKLDHRNVRPGRGGISPLRPLGAMARYISMAALIYNILKT